MILLIKEFICLNRKLLMKNKKIGEIKLNKKINNKKKLGI